jgi:hypothetical protein
MTTDTQHDIDDALRTLLVEPDAELEAALSTSRSNGHARLRAGQATNRRTWRPRTAVVALVGAAALVAVALAPNGRGSHHSTFPVLTANATAAEALRWAGAVAADGAPSIGHGPIWHRVAITYRDREPSRLEERWTDPRSGHYLGYVANHLWDPKTGEPDRGITVGIGSWDGTTYRVRAYSRAVDGGPWSLPPVYAQFDASTDGSTFEADLLGGPGHRIISTRVAGRQQPVNDPEPPAGSYPPYRVSATVDREEGVRRWVRAVTSHASSTDAVRATAIFLRTTRGYFTGTGQDANPKARQATTIRQLVYLLTQVRATPEATRVLYEQFAALDHLKRLSDVTIDGRDAIRIQFETGDYSGSNEQRMDPTAGDYAVTHDEVVLVIDRGTGVPIRTETLDRSGWTEIVELQRVSDIGSARYICRTDPWDIPCDIVDEKNVVARQADALAASPRWSSIGESMGRSRFLFDIPVDHDGLPVGDVDEPIATFSDDWGTKVPVLPLQPLPDDALGR